MGELVIRHSEDVAEAGPFRFTRAGLEVSGEPGYEEWERCGQFLQAANKRVHPVRHRVRQLEHARAAAVARHADELAALDAELGEVRAGCPHLQTRSFFDADRSAVWPVVVCAVCGADLTGGQS